MTVVTREEMIESSVSQFARQALTARGYTDTEWRMLESFPYTLEHFDVNSIAVGFNFDDGGRQAELGSNLKERQHTIEFFVFGKTNTWGRNLANAIKFGIENTDNGMLPLLDVTQDGQPIIDYLYLDAVFAHHQPIPDPEPWQQFTWLTTVKVTDIYYPNLS